MTNSGKINSLQGLRFILFLTIFMFHCSIFLSGQPIYSKILAGGGTLAVTCFFVLSGFVAALSQNKNNPQNIGEYIKYIFLRIKKFYPYHIIFLVASIPLSIFSVIAEPIDNLCKFLIHSLLLQSWFSNSDIRLGFNSVAWFLSTTVFLTCCCPLLVKINNRISAIKFKKIKISLIYFIIILVCCVTHFVLALTIHSNDRFWLYAFPPVRLLDYASGFFAGRLFVYRKQFDNKTLTGYTYNILELFSVIIYLAYLIIFPYIPVSLGRAAVSLPGAVFIVYIFSHSGGFISKFFESKIMVRLGNATLYYFISHQLFLKYLQIIYKRFLPHRVIVQCLCIAMAFTMTIISEIVFEKIRKMILKRRK